MGGKKKKQPLDIEKVFQIICGVGQDNQTHLQKVIFILFLFTWLNKAENPNRFSDLFLLSFLLSANILDDNNNNSNAGQKIKTERGWKCPNGVTRPDRRAR